MSKKFTTMTVGGAYGPTWSCDDIDEATAVAEERGYDVLDVVEGKREGEYLLVVAD